MTPNPFTSGGARWNVMAGYGAQLEQGKSPEQAREYLRALFAERRRPGQERPRVSDDVRLRQGRRPARLRERGDLRAAPGPADRVRRPRRDDPDREPGRGDRGRLGRGPRLPRVPHERRGAEGLRRGGLPAGREVRARDVRLPDPAGLFTIADVGGWDTVQEEFFDRETGFMADVQRGSASRPTERARKVGMAGPARDRRAAQ